MKPRSPPTAAPEPALWHFLGSSALAAVLANLGTLHRGQHADSIIPVLVSLYRWTPFYWDQGRYGQLVPWLAQPLHSPLVNLLVQGSVTAFCLLSTFGLLARYVVRDGTWQVLGVTGAAGFLALTDAPYRFEYLVSLPHGLSLALALGSLGLRAAPCRTRGGWLGAQAGAVALSALAHWVNLATSVYLLPLVLCLTAIRSGRREWASGALDALVLLAGTGIGLALAGLSDTPTPLGGLSPGAMLPAAAASLKNVWLRAGQMPWAIAAALLLVAGAVLLAWPAMRARAAWPARESLGLIAAATCSLVLVASRTWVKANGFGERYVFPCVVFAFTAAVLWGLGPLSTWLRPRVKAWGRPTVVLVLPALAVVAYGLPSVDRVRRLLNHAPQRNRELVELGATHLAGNYWEVWPSVFYVNLLHHERGDGKVIWGLTARGSATRAEALAVPRDRVRIGVALDDGLAGHFMQDFEPVERVARTSQVELYAPCTSGPACGNMPVSLTPRGGLPGPLLHGGRGLRLFLPPAEVDEAALPPGQRRASTPVQPRP